MAKGRRGKAKKKAAARRATEKFAQSLEEPVEPVDIATVLLRAGAKNPRAPPARRREPLHVRSFAGKIFDPNNEGHTAMVRVAIAAGRDEDKTTSSELVTYVFGATGFRRTTKGGSRCHYHLTQYVGSQCASKDRTTKEKPWWDGIKSFAKAKAPQLVFVERDNEGNAIVAWSCRRKQVNYPADSGLITRRGSIGFSVEVLGEKAATQFALEESQATLGLLRKPEKVQEDIAARKASGGAVAPIKGGAKATIDTGIYRVEVDGVTKLRVRYGPKAARIHEDFPDTDDGLQEARVFVYAKMPLAVRRVQNAANLEVLPFAESLDELPYRYEDAVAAHEGRATPPAVGDAASLRAERLRRRGASKGADGGDGGDDGAAPPPKRRAAARARTEEAGDDDADDAPMALGGCDDGAAAVVPASKRLKDDRGGAVDVPSGLVDVLDGLPDANLAAAAAWVRGQGLSNVYQIKELDDRTVVDEFLDAAGLTADMRAARRLAAKRISKLESARAAPSDDRDVDDAPAAPTPAARPAKRGRSGGDGGAETTPRTLPFDPQQEKYSKGLDDDKCKPTGRFKKTLEREARLHLMKLKACGARAAGDYHQPIPARRTQCIGMCDVDAELRRIYKAALKKRRGERLGYINRRVWDGGGGAVGRRLLCKEYGIDEDDLTDAQFAYLKPLWKCDAMWNAKELPLEALVLRPVTFHLRWMDADEGATTERCEVMRYYGDPRFKHATRTVSRATAKKKELEQCCL